MKRKTTKEILAESFRELAQEKPVDGITVREIIENCDYSNATFYRHFHDKYELIAWEYSQRVAAIMSRVGKNGYSWKQTLLDGALMFQRERDYLANLLQHTSGHDAFIRYWADINYNALRQLILKTCDIDEVLDAVLRIYVLGTVNLSCEWILGNSALSPEALAECYMQALPQSLRQYLVPNERKPL